VAPDPPARHVPLRTVARHWTRIGITGFGGPPVHIALFRQVIVTEKRWLEAREFEDAVAACNLLPGPASTQLAIYCAQRLAGPAGALAGGLGFILPAVAMILVLSAVFLGHTPPDWIRGAGAGAGAAVPAVAVHAARELLGPSWTRAPTRVRWLLYVGLGVLAGALTGPYLVLVLLGCGLFEVGLRSRALTAVGVFPGAAALAGTGGIAALAWTAFKVGALSYGGGFVIVPLMQGDAVHTYHWMTGTQFLDAVALGQVTPGPVVATVAAVGYAAHGIGGGLLAALIAFAPSFAFVLVGGPQFERLRENARAQAFLAGAGPAAVGTILGAAIPLAGALRETWQFSVLGAAAVGLLLLRRGTVATLAGSGAIGVIVALAGGPVPR
jgi:chromate transporter